MGNWRKGKSNNNSTESKASGGIRSKWPTFLAGFGVIYRCPSQGLLSLVTESRESR